jgi:murein DD-endopeptidase MepM/ murein hydrolase activator NlpD
MRMTRVAVCLFILSALCSTAAYAKRAETSCTTHRQIIQAGDQAIDLVSHDGVHAAQFTEWLHRADASTRHKLTQMRPGDIFTACTDMSGRSGPALVSLRIERDPAGRKRADQIESSPQQSHALFAGVIGDAITVPLSAAHIEALPISATGNPQPSKKATSPLLTSLTPGRLLSQELIRQLGHRPVVEAIVDYARERWNLPSRLPKDSHCTLALLPSGKSGSAQQLAYVELTYRGQHERVYHYVDSLGHDLMVGAQGQGYRVLDPVLPVSNAHISSGWGWRIQPVLGGDEFHQGIDYAAPNGTPVRATMDGVVDIADWRGNYGRLVEVKHGGDLATRYGHLSAFADRLQVGSHVRRGQIIGYVGATGLSTGPHLYYELWNHGSRVDPLKQKRMMVAADVSPSERRRFRDYVARINSADAP